MIQKIGILTCIKSNDVCARVGCLKAFNNKSDFFKEYDSSTELAAMMTCNACKEYNTTDPMSDPGIIEKVERLQTENIEVIHCGVCRLQGGIECERFSEICKMIEDKGIKVIKGTHRE